MVKALGPVPDRLAAFGIVVTGFAWSLGSLAARWDLVMAAGLPLLQSAMLILLGGIAAAVAVWFGISAVVWAMIRVLRGHVAFGRVLLAVSATTPPMWLATPAAALLIAGEPNGPVAVILSAIVSIGGALFMSQLAGALRDAATFSTGRSWACIALSAIFVSSFVSLQI